MTGFKFTVGKKFRWNIGIISFNGERKGGHVEAEIINDNEILEKRFYENPNKNWERTLTKEQYNLELLEKAEVKDGSH